MCWKMFLNLVRDFENWFSSNFSWLPCGLLTIFHFFSFSAWSPSSPDSFSLSLGKERMFKRGVAITPRMWIYAWLILHRRGCMEWDENLLSTGVGNTNICKQLSQVNGVESRLFFDRCEIEGGKWLIMSLGIILILFWKLKKVFCSNSIELRRDTILLRIFVKKKTSFLHKILKQGGAAAELRPSEMSFILWERSWLSQKVAMIDGYHLAEKSTPDLKTIEKLPIKLFHITRNAIMRLRRS